MADLQNTSQEGTQTGTEGTQSIGKTFTQDDVNRIVQERLAKEKGKATNADDLQKRSDELDKRTAELDAKESRLNALTTIRGAGYPDELADAIKCSNADELKKSMEIIDKIIGERTPRGWSPKLEEKRSHIIPTAPMSNCGPLQSSGIREAMGLRG